MKISQRAREALADRIEARGLAWKNAASSIRSGSFSNVWIQPALEAIEMLLPQEVHGAE